MAIKLSGLHSGMDTESIISELVKVKSDKKIKLEGEQKRLSWKQEAWKSLNTKIYGFYSKSLSGMRFTSDYNKKTTTSSHSAVSVITSGDAPNVVQTMKIEGMAKAGYLTGADISKDGKKYDSSTKLVEDLGIKADSTFTITSGGVSKNIKITDSTTIGDVITVMREAGVNANFDKVNQRFYISSKNTGKGKDFTLTSNNADGLDAMAKLGIAASLDDDKNTKEMYENYKNALVYENGVLNEDATIENLKKLSVFDDALAQNIKENDYSKIIEDAKKAIEEKTKALEEAKTKYPETYKVADGYLQAKDADGNLLTDAEGNAVVEMDSTKIQAAMDELLKKYDTVDTEGNPVAGTYENLTEDEKAIYDKYADQLEAAKIVDSIQKELDTQNENLTNAQNLYDVEKGEATEALIAAVAQEQLEKAKEAEQMLDLYANSGVTANAVRIAGEDSAIILNGVRYEAERNTFEINGLTITLNSDTREEITLSTQEDTNGIYDMVKGFLKEYNELINEMDKLYNADSASKYTMLTKEEKEAMSEDEVEEWEKKIKDGLLRRDSTLSTVFEAMKNIMLSGVKMSDGTTLYLSEFGINTLGYFNAEENEKNAYHIDGDPDDASTMNNTDKLKAAIAKDPEQVAEFFANLSRSLYDKLDDLMERTDYSSAFTVYNDKALQKEYDNYKEKIADQEEKIAKFEDRYYDKFTAMEVAMSKLTNQQNAISSLFG